MEKVRKTAVPQVMHLYIDEAGDMAFYHKVGRHRVPIQPGTGASSCFMMGMTRVKEDPDVARSKILEFSRLVEGSPILNYPHSVQKTIERGGHYYPHAKNDPAQIRHAFFTYISTQIDFTTQVVVGRKRPELFERRHHKKEAEFYADLMSHLLKDKGKYPKLVLHVAERGSTTANVNLQNAVGIAKRRNANNPRMRPLDSQIEFNVQEYSSDPLLALTDYALWSVQRVFEHGDTYFYDMLMRKGRIPLVFDPYNTANYANTRNWYTPSNPLTGECQVWKEGI